MQDIFHAVQDVGLPTVLCLLVFYQFIKVTNKIVESVERNMKRISEELRASYHKKNEHLERIYSGIQSVQANINYLAGRLDAKRPVETSIEPSEEYKE